MSEWENIANGADVVLAWYNKLENALGLGYPISPASFSIHKLGSNYIARNNLTGVNDYRGTNATTVIQAALDALTYGGSIYLATHRSTYASTIFQCGQLLIPDALKSYGVRICGDTMRMPTIEHTGTDESLLAVETNTNDYYYITLENIRFASGASTGAYPIIDFDGVNQSTIRNCTLVGQTDQSNDGILLGGGNEAGYYNKLLDNYLWRLDTAIDIDSGYNGNILAFNNVYDVDVAYDINGGTTKLFGCTAEQVDEKGLTLGANATYPEIYGLRLENTVSEGIGVEIVAGCVGAKIIGGTQSSFATPISSAVTDARIWGMLGIGDVYPLEHHTGDDTLTLSESGTIHTNLGAAGAVTLTLPQDAVAGTKFTFSVMTGGQQLRIDPGAAGAFYIAGAKQTDGKYVWADDEGEFMTCVCDGNGDWFLIAGAGTWGVEV